MTAVRDPLAWLTLAAWLAVLGLFLGLLALLLVSVRVWRIRLNITWSPPHTQMWHASQPLMLGATAAIAGAIAVQVSPDGPLLQRLSVALGAAVVTGALAYGFWIWVSRWADRRARLALDWSCRAVAAADQLSAVFDVNQVAETAYRILAEQLCCTHSLLYQRGADGYAPVNAQAAVFPLDGAVARHINEVPPFHAWRVRDLHGLDASGREALASTAAELLVALPGGFLILGPLEAERPYAACHLRFAESVAVQVASALASARHAVTVFDQVAEQAHQQASRRTARSTRVHLAPPERVDLPDAEIAAQYWTGDAPGGCFYDIISLPNRGTVLLLAEVPGPAEEASVRLVQFQALVRTRARVYNGDLAELVESTGRAIALSAAARPPIAVFCCRYRAGTGHLHYVNAGHFPPFVLRHGVHGAEVLRLAGGGDPLGTPSETPFVEREFVLQAGDRVVVASSGFVQAKNPDGQTWGESGLIDTLLGTPVAHAHELAESVLDAALQFSAHSPLDPPRTLLALKYQ